MRVPSAVCCLLAFALSLEVAPPSLMAQTDAFLKAPLLPRGRSVGVQLNGSGKAVEWQLRAGETPVAIGDDALLLTRDGFKIGYLHYNPLRVSLDVSVADFEDPSKAPLQALLDALKAFPLFASGPLVAASYKVGSDNRDAKEEVALSNAIECTQIHLTKARNDLSKLPETIDTAWRVPAATGPMALGAAITLLKEDQSLLNADLDGLTKAAENYKIASEGSDPGGLLYQTDDLTKKLPGVAAAMKAAETPLVADAKLSHWNEPDHIIFLTNVTIDPTLATGKAVTVTITPVTMAVTENDVSFEKGKPVTATFKVRRYRALLPEVGVGAVIGYIDRPKYGTSTDSAGKTVVALSSTDHMSADPAVMVNFVCRCNTGQLAPMLQVGVATSKDLPALLLGGGIRLFGLGKGDFAVGGGLLLGWYKDLQKLKVGSVISGTADIDADLGYINTPKPAPYITLQYKF